MQGNHENSLCVSAPLRWIPVFPSRRSSHERGKKALESKNTLKTGHGSSSAEYARNRGLPGQVGLRCRIRLR
jgi:hypothetical protein